VKLVSLSEQGVIGSLMKSLLCVEGQGHPQADLPVFLLQIPD
jgi:hypothetical protein